MNKTHLFFGLQLEKKNIYEERYPGIFLRRNTIETAYEIRMQRTPANNIKYLFRVDVPFPFDLSNKMNPVAPMTNIAPADNPSIIYCPKVH